jgi:hypothetical protein
MDEDFVCEDCRGYAEEKRPCPYNEAMGGMMFELYLCDACYQLREEEI